VKTLMTDDTLRSAYLELNARRQKEAPADDGAAFAAAADAVDRNIDPERRTALLLTALEHGHADDLRLLQSMRDAATDSATTADSARTWWARPSVWMSAAAVLIVAIALPQFAGERGEVVTPRAEERAAGNTEIDVVTPSERWTVAALGGAPIRVEWRAVPTATEYAVEVVDVSGMVRHRYAAGTDTTLTLPALPVDVPPGSAWWVTARLRDGRSLYSALRPIDD
jgi:hypothetical protein